jgi:hypothetical protein
MLIGLGVFFDIIGITGATIFSNALEAPPITYLAIFGLCTITFLIPGIILYSMGRRMGKEELDREIFASILNTYQKVSIPEAAAKLGKSEQQIEQLILDCVRTGLVKGFIDTEKRLFIKEGYNPDEIPDDSEES